MSLSCYYRRTDDCRHECRRLCLDGLAYRVRRERRKRHGGQQSLRLITAGVPHDPHIRGAVLEKKDDKAAPRNIWGFCVVERVVHVADTYIHARLLKFEAGEKNQHAEHEEHGVGQLLVVIAQAGFQLHQQLS